MNLRRQFALITAITISLLVVVLYIVVSTMMPGALHNFTHLSLSDGAVRSTLIMLTLCAAAVVIAMILAGERLITQPLIEMSRDAREIAADPAHGRRINLGGGTELTSLGISLNQMLDALDNAREQESQARSEAETANRTKSDFLAMVSHELRTPLTAINGMTELLAESGLTTAQQELVTALHSSVNGLHHILNDILDLSQIEAGKMELEALPFSPQELLNYCLTPYRHQAQRKGITLTWQVDDNCPERLIGAGDRLRQILHNLVANALKFTHQGGVEVRLSPLSRSEQNLQLCLTVSDSGIGMSTETCMRIFHPYTQATPATRREYGGTGLGLTISRRLTELMGGTISAESAPGAGSTFTVTLPFDLDVPQTGRSRSEATVPPGAA